MKILAFETSCDETSVALVHDGLVLSNVVASQIDTHKIYGGVVPEIAARQHLQNIEPVIDSVFQETGLGPNDIDGVAATRGPGLPPAISPLLVSTITMLICIPLGQMGFRLALNLIRSAPQYHSS